MLISSNIMSLNAQRNLAITGYKMARALERLSSGLRINRAADDAAGLAISERMRGQIRGMQQGVRNAQDGVSMIQTGEGALSETHAILQRMRELAVQGGSTTLSSSDRQALGDELLTLRSEIDNIASRTRFNGQNLLTGTLSATAAGTLVGDAVVSGGATVTTSVDATSVNPAHTFTVTGALAAITITNTTTNVTQVVSAVNMVGTAVGEQQTLNFDKLGIKLTLAVTTAGAGPWLGADYGPGVTGDSLSFTGSGSATYRVGAEAADNISVAFTDMQSTALGSGGASNLDDLVVDNNAVSTTAQADTLLTSIDAAIDQVSSQRSKLGAAQNQMESAINSLGVSIENMAAADSRIRDADIAAVSTELITRQIMQQAGVAVLSQANSAPQSMLSLLQR